MAGSLRIRLTGNDITCIYSFYDETRQIISICGIRLLRVLQSAQGGPRRHATLRPQSSTQRPACDAIQYFGRSASSYSSIRYALSASSWNGPYDADARPWPLGTGRVCPHRRGNRPPHASRYADRKRAQSVRKSRAVVGAGAVPYGGGVGSREISRFAGRSRTGDLDSPPGSIVHPGSIGSEGLLRGVNNFFAINSA